MTRSELATGLSIFLMVAAAGIVSTTYVNRYFAVARSQRERRECPAKRHGVRRRERLLEELVLAKRAGAVAQMLTGGRC